LAETALQEAFAAIPRQDWVAIRLAKGLESHCLSDGADGDRPELRCDCLDYAKGEQACKYVLAVRLYCNDSELRAAADRMGQSSAEHFDLFGFWFDGSLGAKPQTH
jgi:hypothetical protein